MDGDNQYFCDNCQSKRSAKRMTKINKLPPVLNLQLLRFVYDRNSGYKKKLSKKIKFSEVLDLSEYIGNINGDTNEPIYQLGAILMHVGKSAYSGHYMAHIKNFETNEWYNFNDESITKIKKKQQLGCTDEEIESAKTNSNDAASSTTTTTSSVATKRRATATSENSPTPSPAPPPSTSQQATNSNSTDAESENNNNSNGGEASTSTSSTNTKSSNAKVFSTTNAYLLVYYRREMINPKGMKQLLNLLNSNKEIIQLETITKDNHQLDLWFQHLRDTKLDQTENKNTERALIRSIYDTLWCNNDNKSTTDSSETNSDDKQNSSSTTTTTTTTTTTQSQKFYFVLTDFIRKLLSTQTNLFNSSIDGNCTNSSIIQKYMCTHKCLNPLAINKFKLVNRTGLDSILSYYSLSLEDIGAFDAQSKTKTKCLECVKNVFMHLKLKAKLSEDQKLLKALMKSEETDAPGVENVNGVNCQNGNSDDVILLDDSDNKTTNGNNIRSDSENQSTKRFWIGTNSLKIWTSLASKKAESYLPPIKFNEPEIIDLTQQQSTKTESESNDTNNNNNNNNNTNSNEGSCCDNNNNDGSNDAPLTNTNQFNDDIVCEHGNLSPTLNKRLVSEHTAQLFFQYFPNMRFFQSNTPVCKQCLINKELYMNKNNEVKGQKELLPDLYSNKNRPNLNECPDETILYVINVEFVKEWRSMIRNSKYKQIKIINEPLLCIHKKLDFNELNISSNVLAYLLTSDEWTCLKSNYEFDHEIKLQKIDSQTYIFEPFICENCIQQNEINKILYENKKIFIRQRDDDLDEAPPSSNTNKDECEIIHVHNSKKPRLENDEDNSNIVNSMSQNSISSPSQKQQQLSQPTRRSKRSRKCKGDIEVVVSSFETIRQVKLQIVSQINKLVSEQHLFFNSIELENDRTLIDYNINPGDVLRLKTDAAYDESENTNYEMAYAPEIGFKGTNLIS